MASADESSPHWSTVLARTLQPALRRDVVTLATDEYPSPHSTSPLPLRLADGEGTSSPTVGWVTSRPPSPPAIEHNAASTSSVNGAGGDAGNRTVALAWGANHAGQLGLGDFLTRVTPRPIDALAQTSVRALVCGSRSSLALDKEGRVFSWGKGEDGTLGIGDRGTVMKPRLVTALLRHPISLIACRGAHVLALDTAGHVWAWGRNDDGQLGVRRDDDDDEREKMGKPQRVQALGGRVVTAIGCGRTHSVALTAEGELYSWGCGDDGVLGHGDTRSRPTPTRCARLVAERVVTIACGSRHTLALTSDDAPQPTTAQPDGGGAVRRGEEGADGGGGGGGGGIGGGGGGGGARQSLRLFSWGWGVYAQLGHGDLLSRFAPCVVQAVEETLRSSERVMVACGYRHSMMCCEHAAAPSPDVVQSRSRSEPDLSLSRERASSDPTGGGGGGGGERRATTSSVWAWGWGRHGQLGLGHWSDHVASPQRLPAGAFGGRRVAQLCLGGRHSLAITHEGAVFAFGRDDDGQLGLGAAGARCVPTIVLAEDNEFGVASADARSAAGWGHTMLLLQKARRTGAGPDSPRGGYAGGYQSLWRWWLNGDATPLFVRGDFEGMFGQLIGTTIQFMLVQKMLGETCGFGARLLNEELLPGVASVYLLGHAFFGLQGFALGRRTGKPSTALPMGVNIVPFFAFTQLLMAPTYRRELEAGADTETASRAAYDMGLAACVLSSLLELVGVFFVDSLRQLIPRAAMLAAISGVTLTFVSMGFIAEIFAAPCTALVPMLLMLAFYAGRIKLPLPGGFVALGAGILLAAVGNALGLGWFVPPQLNYAPAFQLPSAQRGCWALLGSPAFLQAIAVVVPMWLVGLVNNLANVESAAIVGDTYDARRTLLGLALLNLASAALGNPFPSCIYVGHSAFKAMGARNGYLFLNMVPVAFYGLMHGAAVLPSLLPIEGGIGFLMWVGLQITAHAFEGDNTPEGWRHGPAIALGLLPSIAAWSWQRVELVFEATRGVICADLGPQARRSHELCVERLAQLINISANESALALTETEHPARLAFQRELSSQYLVGMYALSNGYLLSATILSAMLVHIIDGKFNLSALWLLVAAAASAVGAIHSPQLNAARADQRFTAMYLLAALLLFFIHAGNNRGEQLKELQVRWAMRLRPLAAQLGGLSTSLWRALGGRVGTKGGGGGGILGAALVQPQSTLSAAPSTDGPGLFGGADADQQQRDALQRERLEPLLQPSQAKGRY